MHALFFANRGGGDGAPTAAFFMDLTDDEAVAALLISLFFADDLVPTVLSFLRFFFAEDLGASGEVDMSRSGAWKSLTAAT